MTVISIRDFRTNQGKYLGLAAKGESVILTSRAGSFKKAGKLLGELQDHPKTGTGKPEALGGDRSGQWSRRISQRHRLICRCLGIQPAAMLGL